MASIPTTLTLAGLTLISVLANCENGRQDQQIEAIRQGYNTLIAERNTQRLAPKIKQALPVFDNGSYRFFLALMTVESGGNPFAEGGAGEVGPFQITKSYLQDACPDGRWTLEDCKQVSISMAVIERYMRRWCPEAWAANDWETIARTHNGGPSGPTKDSTLHHWRKVERLMETY